MPERCRRPSGVPTGRWPVALVAAVLLVACTDRRPMPEPAELILKNGVIHTVNDAQPRAEAVAIRDTRYIAIGSDEAIAAYAGKTTRIIDLDGRFAMPGINDGHLHPVRGALKALYHCSFAFAATPEEIRDTVRACVENQPEAEWIRGGQWDSGFFERFELASPRAFLDAVSGDKAVYLSDDSGHNAWVNSKALVLAGIDRETLDPPGGKFVRDAAGDPNGVLLETAEKQMREVVPDYTGAQYLAAATAFPPIANALGITGAKAAAMYEAELDALNAIDGRGKLSVHMAVSIRTPDGKREQPLDYARLETIRDRYRSVHLHTGFVKIFLDGVPTPARTAAMLEPYLPDAEHGAQFSGGALLVGIDALASDVRELDERGFTVKMHAAGDRSLRAALDAIEAAREANGASGLRHEIAHAGFIHPEDLARFAELDAVADLSPVLWHPSPIIAAIARALGEERTKQYWPVRDLLDSGAPVLAGSDWPSAVPDASPWTGIEAFVTRRDPRGATPGELGPEQRITLAEAIRIYTLDGAKSLRLEAVTGSIDNGKSADLIVLDRNPFETRIDDVSDTRVLYTFFEGRLVHEQAASAAPIPSHPTVTELRSMLDAGRTTSLALVDELLRRATAMSALNAFITLDADGARAAARERDRDRELGGPAGPLNGIPIVVKDNIHVAGLPNTAGTPALREFVPTHSNEVVERLAAAGAVILGKTNLHELAFGITSNNAAFGAVRNPYDTQLFAGGSSGGTASAVSAGLAPAGLGTDTGGSARIPAALTGVVGFRPSTGRYSSSHVTPISRTRDTIGLVAQRVGDIVLLDGVITAAPTSVDAPPADLIRLGVPRGYFYAGLDEAVASVVDTGLARLREAGVTLIEMEVPGLAELIANSAFPIALFEAGRDIPAYLDRHATGIGLEELAAAAASPDVKGIFAAITGDGQVSAAAYAAAIETRETLRGVFRTAFTKDRLDAIVFPTTVLAARPIESSLETVQLNGKPVPTFPTYIRNTDPASIAALPGVSLPVGLTADGLPVGLEIDGPEQSDRHLLAVAKALETILGFSAHPSPSIAPGSPRSR